MKMRQGLVTVDTNLVVDQGTKWSVFPVSEKKLGLVVCTYQDLDPGKLGCCRE